MAFRPGHVAWFALDNAAGSLTVLQPYIDSIDAPQSSDMLDVSTIGTQAKGFIVGQTGGDSVEVGGPYDTALHAHIGSLIAAQNAGTASHSYLYGPGGSVSGQPKISGEVLVANYTPSVQVAGRTEWKATLQVTGAVTNSTW